MSLQSRSHLLHTLNDAFFIASSAAVNPPQPLTVTFGGKSTEVFLLHRQIASQPQNRKHVLFSWCVYRGGASNTRKPSQCLFVSLWQTSLPSSLGENWRESSILTVWDGLRAWYRMCDQLKHTAVLSPICLKRLCIIDCFGCDVSFSRWITELLICSHQSSCCLIYPHPSPVLVCVRGEILTWTIRQHKQVYRGAGFTGNEILKLDCDFWK